MFQFNFKVEEDNKEENMILAPDAVSSQKKWLQAQLHHVTNEHVQALSADSTVEEVTIGQTQLKYLSMVSALERLKKNEACANILPVFTDNTDLVPAVYEGGLKIWECSWDLLNHMVASSINLKGCRVLELGCGAGLPAIYTMLHGAHVTLQDYNEEVINYITIPNVILNTVDLSVLEDESTKSVDMIKRTIMSKSLFYSGDWGELDKLLATGASHGSVNPCDNEESSNKSNEPIKNMEEHKFDLILTSETIYNPECHEKLLNLMTKYLKQNGKILLAAKSYYFGVGGGILKFCDLVKSQGHLNVKTLVTNETGVKREILEMTLKNSS